MVSESVKPRIARYVAGRVVRHVAMLAAACNSIPLAVQTPAPSVSLGFGVDTAADVGDIVPASSHGWQLSNAPRSNCSAERATFLP